MKLIGQVLWFVIRLILLVLTGEWVKGNLKDLAQGQPVPAKPTPGGPPPPPGGLNPGQHLAALRDQVGRVEAQANALRTQTLQQRSFTTLLDEGLFSELARARSELQGGTLTFELGQRVAALEEALQALQAVGQSRAEPSKGVAAADTEALISAGVEPLYEHLRSLPGESKERLVVAVPRVRADLHARPQFHTRLLFVETIGLEPLRILRGSRALARAVVDDLPSLLPNLRAALRLPAHATVPNPQGVYDPTSARASLGTWLPELSADALTTLMLGPAFARGLADAVARPVAPLEVRSAGLYGAFLSPTPPALLRVLTCTATLERLGFHEEAAHLEADFRARHPGPPLVFLPRADGSAVGVPEDFMLGQLEDVLVELLDEPHAALGDETFLDVPGFAFLHGELAEAREAQARFLRATPSLHAPRVCAAAALSALAAEPALRAQVLSALARSVRGKGTLEAVSQPDAAAPLGKPLHGLVRLSRDRAELRAALAIGAAFERPGGLGGARRAPGVRARRAP